MLKNFSRTVKEDWIIGGDFNEVMDENEKSRSRRKSKEVMDEFREVVNGLALVDIKPNKRWFTWSNNRRGGSLVKERLDRYLVSTSWIGKVPFLFTTVLRQASSNHDVIILEIMGRRLREGRVHPKLSFHFEECWAHDRDAKGVIKDAWDIGFGNVLDKICMKQAKLGTWQKNQYKTSKWWISHLYNAEEIYWSQRTRIKGA